MSIHWRREEQTILTVAVLSSSWYSLAFAFSAFFWRSKEAVSLLRTPVDLFHLAKYESQGHFHNDGDPYEVITLCRCPAKATAVLSSSSTFLSWIK
jgi:hypothetical protein